MKSQTDISHYCHANPVRSMDLNGMFDTEDEVMWFSFHNDINGSATQRQDGSYELYDPNTRFTYYHNADGMLHTEIPEVSVSAVRPTQGETTTVLDHIANGLTTADEWTNDVVRPIASGGILLIPIISLTNSGYTLYYDEDIYGNKAGNEDYMLSAIDIATAGFGKVKYINEAISIGANVIGKVASIRTIQKTIGNESEKNVK